jgi:acetolactate synthase-1/2/3 large subunit
MAREGLDVTVVICANGSYKILDVELHDAGIELDGEAADLTSLSNPAISFVDLARGFGVQAEAVSTGAELSAALARVSNEPGPHLIEARL